VTKGREEKEGGQGGEGSGSQRKGAPGQQPALEIGVPARPCSNKKLNGSHWGETHEKEHVGDRGRWGDHLSRRGWYLEAIKGGGGMVSSVNDVWRKRGKDALKSERCT